MRILISSLCLLFFSLGLQAQKYSRSGFPAQQEDKDRFRRFPCGGNVILEEGFENGLPAGWQILDVDQLEPRAEIDALTPDPGWQIVNDFKQMGILNPNQILASPSYYKDTVASSNDYLILPQLTLPNNTCLSWYAYSQDVEFGESYEIRVSTTTPDEAGFLANPAVFTVEDQGSDFTFETASLADYGGQTVYIAFRHTSNDKFILALDDIRLAEVESFDMAVFEVDEFTINPGDSVFLEGSVINRGLTPVVFDSMQLRISGAINGNQIFSFGVADSFELLPNDTIQWVADSSWKADNEATVLLEVWVSGFGVDDQTANDTLSRFQAVGNTVSIQDDIKLGELQINPNPVSDQLRVNLEAFAGKGLNIRILDLQGRAVLGSWELNASRLDSWTLQTASLSPGIYFLKLEDSEGNIFLNKFLKE
ncbi:MAG: choice-of-anchor J domain-containing protein [Bacteroidota bacterium]